MYRKFLNVLRVQAIRQMVWRGCFSAIITYGCLSQGFAAVDAILKVDTAADAAAVPRHGVDTTAQATAPDLPTADSMVVGESAGRIRAGYSEDDYSVENSGARINFVKGASWLRELLGRKISGALKHLSIPGLSFKKIILLAGSLVLILGTVSFYRSRRDRDRFMTTTRLSVMDKEVQRACRFIEDHFDDPALDLQMICAALVTGGAFLEALFVKELGLSIGDFIAQVRVNRAKIQLRKEPGIPVSDLAHTTGFVSAEALAEKFSAISGSGIEAYRKALEKSGDAQE